MSEEIEYPVVTLCGSVRLGKEIWDTISQDLTLEGHTIFTVNVWGQYDFLHSAEGKEVKQRLDEIHKKKIKLSDQVMVLHRNLYLGDSTRSEMAYAEKLGKPILFIDVDNWFSAKCAELRRDSA